MFVHDFVEISILNIYYWVVIFVSYFIFFSLLKNEQSNFDSSNVYVSYERMRLLARMLGLISLLATLRNVLSAGDPLLLLTNAREWESAFGRDVIFNYLYFLHVLALVIYGILVGKGKDRFFDKFIIGLLLLSSVFHGIKFTILHAFLFYGFSYLLVTGEVISYKIKLMIGVLFSILMSFFLFARGGGAEGFFNYITSASVNSLYIINNFEFYNISSPSIFNPFSFLPLDKLQSRLLEGQAAHNIWHGFLLNDKYNLQQVVTRVGFAFGAGLIFYTALFAYLINYLRRAKANEFHKIFFLVMIMDTILLFFTGFDFYKTKLWFNLFIALFFYYLLVFFQQVKFRKLRHS